MDTPHNDKQRKSLFLYKLAQTLVGLIAVCFLIFCIRSPSTSSPSPFQTTSSEKETALKWIFITPYGETDSSYADLFLSQEDCTELAGTPVDLSFCTIEKYLNMTDRESLQMWSPVGTPTPTLNDWKQPELPGLCRTCWTRKSPALPCPKTLSGGAEIFREMFTPIRIPEPFSLRIPLSSLPPL
mgnify:CR=1 FL=1